jgi:hypothetical protein
VETAGLRHRLLARALVQVEGVGEHDLRAEPDEIARLDAPHGAVGGDRHERGRLDHAAPREQEPAARGAIPSGELEAQRAHRISIASP